jgi:putative SOS response-associated peptidase YedK
MCGRFSLSNTAGLARRFNLAKDLKVKARYNIAPSQKVFAIIRRESNIPVQFVWGLIPFWAQELSGVKMLINARGETVDSKASFKNSFYHRRCLIPADGFYEWKKVADGKQPYRITLPGGEVFAFAGLWGEWTSPRGELIRSCAIITTGANSFMQALHHRMPVIMAPEDEATWLSPNADRGVLKSLLRPPASLGLRVYPVSRLVNSPHNDTAQVVEPL